MGRSPCCSKDAGLNRGAWTANEDMILSEYIRIHGDGGWRYLAQKAGLKRCGKSCRLRWLNYLRPDIKRGNISPDEEELIIRLHRLLGNRWSLIAGRLPGRTDNEIKNYWNTQLSRRLSDKQSLPKNHTKSEPAPRAGNHVLKSTLVKAKAVRIAKGHNKYAGSYKSNHHQCLRPIDAAETSRTSNSWCSLAVDELNAIDDAEFIDFKMIKNNVESGSQSMGISGHSPCSKPNLVDPVFPHSRNCAENEVNTSESSLYLNGLSSAECDLLSFPCDSPKVFRIHELEARPCDGFEQMCSVNSNLQQGNNITVCDGQGMEKLHNSTQQGDWVDELQYLQKSSLHSLRQLLLESDEEWEDEITKLL